MKRYRDLLISAIFVIAASLTGAAQTSSTPFSIFSGPVDILTKYDGNTLRRAEDTFSRSYSTYFTGEVQTLKLTSKLMARDMPYRVVLPTDYATSKERYPVVFLLHGLSGHYDNWTDKTKVAEYAAAYKFIIVTPEGGDGWYTDSASVPNDKYESYIVKELVPEIDQKFRTLADRDHRVIAGLSMGGYGALKFGLKYPEMFSLVGSFSGAIGATDFNEKNAGPAIAKSLAVIFGAENTDARAANDVFKLVRDLTPEKIRATPYIYQSCGTEDFLFQNNRDFLALLIEKKVPHEYREHPGVHDWKFWDDQVQEFLRVADRRLGGK